MKLDDLAPSAPQTDDLAAFMAAFVQDFGELEGEFTQQGSMTVFRSTWLDHPVEIRGQLSPVNTWEYVINGNRASFPGDYRVRPIEERQQLLIDAVSRSV